MLFPYSVIGIFFSTIAFAFLHQTLDPSAPGNAMRNPRRSAGFTPGPYAPPYDNNNTGFGQGYPNPNYAPPAGPPPFPYSGPHDRDEDLKPPGYTRDGWDSEDFDVKKKRDEESGPKAGDPRF